MLEKKRLLDTDGKLWVKLVPNEVQIDADGDIKIKNAKLKTMLKDWDPKAEVYLLHMAVGDCGCRCHC